MDENNKQQETRTDFRKTSTANRTLTFRMLAVVFVLYTLLEIIKGYAAGGPDAPSLTLLIIAIVVLGGGSLTLAWVSYRSWKRDKADAEMTEEEIAEMEALRAEGEQASEDAEESEETADDAE